MGGLVCRVHRNAVLRFDSVPTQPVAAAEFDAQVRKLFSLESIAAAVVQKGETDSICALLGKPHFSHADRQALFDFLEEAYED
jgi:hypothetical protein